MSGPRDKVATLTADEPFLLEMSGRFFGIIDAPDAPLDVTLDFGQLLRRGPGGSIYVPEGFSRVELLSSVNQTVRVLIADEPQDVSNIVTGSGGSPSVNVTVDETPSSTLATPAAVTVGTGASSTIAANLTRKRITIAADDGNAGALYLQVPGSGAGRGLPLAAGLFVEIKTTAAIGVRNDTGADAIFTTFEES